MIANIELLFSATWRQIRRHTLFQSGSVQSRSLLLFQVFQHWWQNVASKFRDEDATFSQLRELQESFRLQSCFLHCFFLEIFKIVFALLFSSKMVIRGGCTPAVAVCFVSCNGSDFSTCLVMRCCSRGSCCRCCHCCHVCCQWIAICKRKKSKYLGDRVCQNAP